LTLRLIVESESELEKVAAKIIDYSGEENIWAFYGEMGAGKTALIRAIASRYNVEDNVHSPTFSIVNEYANFRDEIFYHFDFYRIKDLAEAMDIGIEEYFYSGYHCFIEWPQKIMPLLPSQYLRIDINITSPTGREINLSHHG
jgi:tRNA threonylcarbamoyladenosine biosynthesis protein TsaE